MNAYALLVVSQVMLGSIAVFARWAQLPPEVLVLFRCGIAASAIGLLLATKSQLKPYLKLDKTLALLVATGLFMACNWFFFFKAVLTTTIANSILLYNLAPIFVLLSASLFLKEPPTVRQLGCLGLSLVGVVSILGQHGALTRLDPGCVYALTAGALYAQVTVIGRKLKSVPAPVVTFFQTSVGAVLFLALAGPRLGSVTITARQAVILLTIGLFHTAVPYLMYFKALQTVKATIAGILQYIYTLATIIFGAIFFKETVAPAAWLGGALIVASSYVALKHPGSRLLFGSKPSQPLPQPRRPAPQAKQPAAAAA